jgi:hypothetical protein
MEESQLFTVAAADDVENSVLREARAQLDAASIPHFDPQTHGVGFRRAQLDRFCPEASNAILELCLRASTQELEVHVHASHLHASKTEC